MPPHSGRGSQKHPCQSPTAAHTWQSQHTIFASHGRPFAINSPAPTDQHRQPKWQSIFAPRLIVHLALVRVRQRLVRRRNLRELLLRLLLVVEVTVRMPLPGRSRSGALGMKTNACLTLARRRRMPFLPYSPSTARISTVPGGSARPGCSGGKAQTRLTAAPGCYTLRSQSGEPSGGKVVP
jgi:hypothetical protein